MDGWSRFALTSPQPPLTPDFPGAPQHDSVRQKGPPPGVGKNQTSSTATLRVESGRAAGTMQAHISRKAASPRCSPAAARTVPPPRTASCVLTFPCGRWLAAAANGTVVASHWPTLPPEQTLRRAPSVLRLASLDPDNPLPSQATPAGAVTALPTPHAEAHAFSLLSSRLGGTARRHSPALDAFVPPRPPQRTGSTQCPDPSHHGAPALMATYGQGQRPCR